MTNTRKPMAGRANASNFIRGMVSNRMVDFKHLNGRSALDHERHGDEYTVVKKTAPAVLKLYYENYGTLGVSDRRCCCARLHSLNNCLSGGHQFCTGRRRSLPKQHDC